MEDPHRRRWKRGGPVAQAQLAEPLSVAWVGQLAPHCGELCLAKKLALQSMHVEHGECRQSWAFRKLTMASSVCVCVWGREGRARQGGDCALHTHGDLLPGTLAADSLTWRGRLKRAGSRSHFTHVKLAVFAGHTTVRPRPPGRL